MNPIAFEVPSAIACPGHDTGCDRVFRFALRVEFIPAATGGGRVEVTPQPDGAFFSLIGHLLDVHVDDLDRLNLDDVASWANDQVWAAAHAANFDLGKGMRASGYRLTDDGAWVVPA